LTRDLSCILAEFLCTLRIFIFADPIFGHEIVQIERSEQLLEECQSRDLKRGQRGGGTFCKEMGRWGKRTVTGTRRILPDISFPRREREMGTESGSREESNLSQ
jgi:hypothetical protein